MPRLAAWGALRSDEPLTLRAVERTAEERGLDDRDRALARKIVGTEARRRGTLRALVAHFARRKPGPDVAAMLHVGFVQIFFLERIPDHAAVSETVSAASQVLGDGKARYVNACLRAALRARLQGASGDPRRDLVLAPFHLDVPVFHDPAEHPLLWCEEALSMPVALVKRWTKRWGRERATALARGALEEPDLSLRIVRGTTDDVRAALGDAISLRATNHPRILLAPHALTSSVLHTPLFEEGALTVQGESALRAAELVGAREGERILDLCAAPGGKTAVLAASGASVLAVDDDGRRIERLEDTLKRLGVRASVEIRVQDGARGLEPESFDGALVDAPCSNTGVLAARPLARWRFSTESQRQLGELQARLLAEAAACVKRGGRLVYSTCSIEPEENQRRVRAFLAQHPEFELEAEIEASPETHESPRSPELREPPELRGPVDGGYAGRLRKS
jgi:16S rRNA (cytosine967-C5)-methyltransferase